MASLHITKREPRYVLQELRGYEIASDGSGERGDYIVSFLILDLLDNARVVWNADHRNLHGGKALVNRRRKAEKICLSMNANYDHSLNGTD